MLSQCFLSYWKLNSAGLIFQPLQGPSLHIMSSIYRLVLWASFKHRRILQGFTDLEYLSLFLVIIVFWAHFLLTCIVSMFFTILSVIVVLDLQDTTWCSKLCWIAALCTVLEHIYGDSIFVFHYTGLVDKWWLWKQTYHCCCYAAIATSTCSHKDQGIRHIGVVILVFMGGQLYSI